MYFDGIPYLYLGYALILGGAYVRGCTTSNDDPRINALARTGKYSCREEIERYLYHLDMSN